MIAHLFALALVAGQPSHGTSAEQSDLIFARTVQDQRPVIVLGFFAFGSDESTRRLADFARAARVPAEEVERHGDLVEWGVMFPRGVVKAAGLQVIREALSGRLGSLRVELAFVPIDQALDGIDFERETIILPAADLTEPE